MTPEELAKQEAERAANGEQGSPAPSQEKRTEEEKAAFTLKKTAERLTQLGIDPTEVLDIKNHSQETDEDDKPVTMGMLKQIQKSDAQKTALQFANEILDPDVKNKTIEYLSTNIIPSGNAEADFRIAVAAASAEKNKQVIQEIGRYTQPKVTAAGGSAPSHIEEEFVPTSEELRMMQPPYNLSKEKVLDARRRTQG